MDIIKSVMKKITIFFKDPAAKALAIAGIIFMLLVPFKEEIKDYVDRYLENNQLLKLKESSIALDIGFSPSVNWKDVYASSRKMYASVGDEDYSISCSPSPDLEGGGRHAELFHYMRGKWYIPKQSISDMSKSSMIQYLKLCMEDIEVHYKNRRENEKSWN